MKTARHERRERPFTRVSERGVPQVMTDSNGVDEGIDEAERSPQLACDRADLERVRQPGADVRIARDGEDLCFSREATKSAGGEQPIPIATVSFSIREHTEHLYNGVSRK